MENPNALNQSTSTPGVFLFYQKAWLIDSAQVRVYEKSRRIGASWASAAEVTLGASKINGQDAWYIGYNRSMAEEYIRDCAFWARIFGHVAEVAEEELFEDGSSDKSILTYIIRFASGYKITALSSRPTNLRNKRGHIVIDEAAHHPDLKALLQAAMAVLMWGRGARVDIMSTHFGVDNYFNRLVEETRAGKRPYSLHRTTIDDAIAAGLYKRICYVNKWEWSLQREAQWLDELFEIYGEGGEEELRCVPARSGGTYLRRAVIDRQMTSELPVLRLSVEDGFTLWSETERDDFVQRWCREELQPLIEQLPPDRDHFFGEDFGRVSDRTVIVPGYETQQLRYKFPFAVELHNLPFEQQKQVLFYLVDRLPQLRAGALDATGNGAYLAEVAMQRYGENVIHCITLSENWYRENLPLFKAGLEDKRVELVRDADHAQDLMQFKVINGVPKLPKVKNESKIDGSKAPRHGDAAIAYALGYFAARSEPVWIWR